MRNSEDVVEKYYYFQIPPNFYKLKTSVLQREISAIFELKYKSSHKIGADKHSAMALTTDDITLSQIEN